MAKTETKLTAIENAEKTLHDLKAKRNATAAARSADEAAMADVAFEAHTGNEKAAAKLETLRERLLRRDLELKGLDSAIAVAEKKLAEAQANEAAAGQRQAALEIKRLAKELREAGKIADEGLAMFLDATNAMHHVVTRFSTLGLGNPSAIQFVSLGERAVRTVLMDTAFKRAFEVLRPSERQSFASFTAQWAASLDKVIDAKLAQLKQEDGTNVAA